MSDELPVSPELTDLLRELAEHPTAKLFRADAARIVRCGLGAAVACTGTTIRRPAIERELLGVHRAELGYLLRALFVHTVTTDPATRDRHYYFGKKPTREEWTRDAREAVNETPPAYGEESAAELVTRFVEREAGAADLASIAIAAVEVEESASARIYLAQALISAQRWADARALLRDVLQHPVAPLLRKCAYDFMGVSWDGTGRFDRAMHSYAHALDVAEVDGLDPVVQYTAGLNLLINAIRAPDRGNALRAALAVDELGDICPEITRSTAQALDRSQLYGRASRAVACVVANESRGVSCEIAKAFL